jgi:hypothetical protein
MNSDKDVYAAGANVSAPEAPKLSDEQRAGDHKAWLLTWIVLGGLVCLAPVLSKLLVWGLSLALNCDSRSFDEQHVPLCSTGNNSLIYVLGFASRYGWVISIPAGIAVVVAGLIVYAAAEKR